MIGFGPDCIFLADAFQPFFGELIMFLFFSSNLGMLGSIAVSLLLSAVLLYACAM